MVGTTLLMRMLVEFLHKLDLAVQKTETAIPSPNEAGAFLRKLPNRKLKTQGRQILSVVSTNSQ